MKSKLTASILLPTVLSALLATGCTHNHTTSASQ